MSFFAITPVVFVALIFFHVTTGQDYNFAVDISVAATPADYQCLYQKGYSAAFAQAYSPANGGSLNPNVIQNLYNSMKAKLGGEIYVTPTITKDGKTQFDEVFNAVTAAGLEVVTIWLQVTAPITWSNNIQNNINIIQSFVDRALAVGVPPSIYTNWYDWQQITGSYTGFSNLRLWYWNNLGQSIKSVATFDDFRTFGGWTKPAVKQYENNVNICGINLDLNVYPIKRESLHTLPNNKKSGGKKFIVGGVF